MTLDFRDLSNIQLDALKEIGNIGAGNAATSLSQMLGRKIDMAVPKTSILPFNKVVDLVGGAEELVCSGYLFVEGEAPLGMLFLTPQKNGSLLLDLLMGLSEGTTKEFGEMEISAYKEITNILTGAYFNALAMFTNIAFSPSVPGFSLDMAGAILGAVLHQMGEVSDHAFVIETVFIESEKEVKAHFFFLPEPGTLEILLKSLGVGI